jgi:RHS repeat-associated protein
MTAQSSVRMARGARGARRGSRRRGSRLGARTGRARPVTLAHPRWSRGRRDGSTTYYGIGGTTIAERSSTGDVQYLIPDRQGTDTLAVDYQTLNVTRRTYLPFGQERTTPASWPGDDGYVGGTPDPATGLENLGAREYDSASGRFLSPDPVFESSDPTQLGGYDYAGNDPVIGSDPSGLCPADLCGVGTPKGDGSGAIISDGPVDPTDPGGPTEHHGTYYQNGHRESRVKALARVWTDYLTGQYYLTHPLPKPRRKPWYKRTWNTLVSDSKQAAKIAYHYSGASDVVGCLSDPTLGGCSKAAVMTAGFVFTGGEDELEIAAYETGEDVAAEETAGAASDAAGCLEGGPHSFTGTTKVLEAGGHAEPIKDVKTGDTVLATDPQTGETAPHRVDRVIRTTTDHDFTALTVTPAAAGAGKAGTAGTAAGSGTARTAGSAGNHATHAAHAPVTGAVLTTTWHHPFWNATTHQWTEAHDLKPGTHLREPDGTPAVVTAIRNYHAVAVTYDLTIADLHSYYVVAGETPVLVHNCNTTVGRWMSEDEYQAMSDTGKVQAGSGGTSTYVAHPADSDAYRKQAAPGSIYAEFDVPCACLKPAGEPGWAQIPGPQHPIYAKLNSKRGLPPPEMPSFENLRIVDRK